MQTCITATTVSLRLPFDPPAIDVHGHLAERPFFSLGEYPISSSFIFALFLLSFCGGDATGGKKRTRENDESEFGLTPEPDGLMDVIESIKVSLFLITYRLQLRNED